LLAASSSTACLASASVVISYAMPAYAAAPGPAFGAPMPRPAMRSRAPPSFSSLLIGSDLVGDVAFLDAL
jgi:hypothetical protein